MLKKENKDQGKEFEGDIGLVGPLTSTYSYQRDIQSDLKIGGLHFQQCNKVSRARRERDY